MDILPRLRRLAGVGVRFLIVGGISTLIELVSFNLLLYVVGMDLVWAKILSSLIALVNAYFGNREWAFRHRDRRGRTSEIVLFLVTNLVCTLAGAGLVWLGVWMAEGILGRSAGPFVVNVVNLISIVIVVLIRFVLYHRIVFRVRQAPVDEGAS